MTCRIDRLSIEQGVVLRISGRIPGEDLDVLRTALEEGRVVAIDLTEVELVDRDAVTFLAQHRREWHRAQTLSGLHPRMGDERARPQLAPRVLAETAFFEKQSRTGCKGDSDDKARRCGGGNGDSSVSGACAGSGTDRTAQAHQRDAMARDGNRRGRFAGRAARRRFRALARYWATDYDWRKVRGAAERSCPNSSPRSMGWTSTSFTSARNMKMRCRSSSPTDGPARSSSS